MLCSKDVLNFSALGIEYPGSLKCFLLKSSGRLCVHKKVVHEGCTPCLLSQASSDQQIIFIFEWILILLLEVKFEEAMANKYNII